MKDFNFTEFVEVTDEELQAVIGEGNGFVNQVFDFLIYMIPPYCPL